MPRIIPALGFLFLAALSGYAVGDVNIIYG
jgi:hypothetical protein